MEHRHGARLEIIINVWVYGRYLFTPVRTTTHNISSGGALLHGTHPALEPNAHVELVLTHPNHPKRTLKRSAIVVHHSRYGTGVMFGEELNLRGSIWE